ncbi:MAG: A/G-specific adenine glycosylase [Alphaproteobacteria bacterium]|nr:A/G-specific adenine glycosylase [Alphaproteobacteria bacterium]
MALQESRNKGIKQHIVKYRAALLRWYDENRRVIPWRALPGQRPDPYGVWLSEIMCQQTTVQAVKAYYLEFLRRWPSVFDLAAAKEADVMAAWAGLGYYARARNLHRCAGIIATDHGGVFPSEESALLKLPGIGAYTAAAIAAIAFNKPAVVVDGNVERVIARFFAIREALPAVKPHLKALAADFYKGFSERPGDLAQAFMDLGATICIPKAPRCEICPLQAGCAGYKEGISAQLPVRLRSSIKPQRYGYVYWVETPEGEVLLHKRPPQGLLGGMIGLPTSFWAGEREALSHEDVSGFTSKICDSGLMVTHVFTHFNLTLYLCRACINSGDIPSDTGFYLAMPAPEIAKMPSVFQKAARLFNAPMVNSEG